MRQLVRIVSKAPPHTRGKKERNAHLNQPITRAVKRKPRRRLGRRPIIIRQIHTDIIQHVRPRLRRHILHAHSRDDTDDDVGEDEDDPGELQQVVESG